MKKLFSLVLCLCLYVVLLSGCGFSRDDLDEAWEDGHEYGYESGYKEGLFDGAFEAQKDIANEVWWKYQDMEGQTTKERGLHPEEAIIVLNDYLNGKYVSESEIRTAIKSITYFYYHAWDVINEIDDMDFEFNFD